MTIFVGFYSWILSVLFAKVSQKIQKSEKKTKKRTSDIELIRKYLSTQRDEYFRMLYRRYSTKVYSKCLSLLKEEALANDATQDIFMKIFLNLSRFEEKSKFSTWVYSITYNYCIDFLRKRKKEQGLFSDEMDETPDVAEEVPDYKLLEIEVERLKNVLEQIPPGDKEVLLMKYREELSVREIAEVLDKTESAIKMKIKRAKHKAVSVYDSIYAGVD